MIKIKDRMSRQLNSIPVTYTAYDVSKTLTERKFSLIFVSDNGQIVGVVGDVDLVRKVMSQGKNPATTPVTEIMTRQIVTIDLNRSLTEASDLMDKSHVRHLGVTENGKIIGVISVRDLIHPMFTDGEGW